MSNYRRTPMQNGGFSEEERKILLQEIWKDERLAKEVPVTGYAIDSLFGCCPYYSNVAYLCKDLPVVPVGIQKILDRHISLERKIADKEKELKNVHANIVNYRTYLEQEEKKLQVLEKEILELVKNNN